MPGEADSRDMSLPELLAEHVGDESVVAEVPLGGDDRLAVTPKRTLVYRGDGLLSDESVTAYAHDVERIAISTGRRKTKLTLGYGLDDDETISVPSKRTDEVLHPILAGVLSARGVTVPGESVLRTFRFSELTLVVTTDRLVKHVGSAVWDDEFEEFPYADLANLDFEEGTVATAIVLTHAGRSERFKAPNESARAVRETLIDAVCEFHRVDSLEEFRVAVADDEDTSDAQTGTGGTTDFGAGPDPLSASPVADAEAEADANTETTQTGPETQPLDSTAAADTESDSEAASPAEAASQLESTSDGDESVESKPTTELDPTTESEPIADSTADQTVDTAQTTDSTTDPLATDDGFGHENEGSAQSLDPDDDDAPNPVDADGFDGSPFETAGIEGGDLATEVATLRRTVEAQSERLDRQSALIEQLIEELRRGR